MSSKEIYQGVDISYEALMRELAKHSPEVQLKFYTSLLDAQKRKTMLKGAQS